MREEVCKQGNNYPWIQLLFVNKHRALNYRSPSRQSLLVDELTMSDKSTELISIPTERKSDQRKSNFPLSVTTAAMIIQRTWRKHVDIQVYRYYKDLINFHQKGDPAKILRCINPMESKLLDAAAGVFVKFRLAGMTFPPNIYYKIFTQRPVQDICANSPKDYTVNAVRRQTSKMLHNKGDETSVNEREGWYERDDNNGWRLVSDRMMQQFRMDGNTETKPKTFHHNRLQRIQDVVAKKKRRKLEWMQKMYQQGLVRARPDDQETAALIDAATAGMLATVDVLGVGAIHEWEVDELLDWTTALNYDEYIGSWKSIATSSSSSKLCSRKPDMEARKIMSEPLELTFSMSRAYTEVSNRLSHNTPVSNQSADSVHM